MDLLKSLIEQINDYYDILFKKRYYAQDYNYISALNTFIKGVITQVNLFKFLKNNMSKAGVKNIY